MEDILLGGYNAKKSRSDVMWQVLSSLLVFLAAVVSAKNKNAPWLSYICGIAVVVVVLAIFNSAVKSFWRMVYLVPRDKWILRKLNKELTEKLAEGRVVSEFCREMGNLSWENGCFPDCHSFENKYQSLLGFIKSSKASVPQTVMFVSYMFRYFLDDADQFLYRCDNSLQSGIATYTSEYQANVVRKQLGKYEEFVRSYTQMCERVNRQLKTQYLHGVCGHSLNFQWQRSLDKTSGSAETKE